MNPLDNLDFPVKGCVGYEGTHRSAKRTDNSTVSNYLSWFVHRVKECPFVNHVQCQV